MINQNCTGKDRQQAQDFFDRWLVFVDPNIDNPAKRIRGTDADTGGPIGRWTSRFNYGFFAFGNRLSTFAHEFRHLNQTNLDMRSSSYMVIIKGTEGIKFDQRPDDRAHLSVSAYKMIRTI